jgi:hypothetical protein
MPASHRLVFIASSLIDCGCLAGAKLSEYVLRNQSRITSAFQNSSQIVTIGSTLLGIRGLMEQEATEITEELLCFLPLLR